MHAYISISVLKTKQTFFKWKQTAEDTNEFEDNKGIIKIRKSKKNRQHDGQRKKYKKTNNDLQNIHIKPKIELHEPKAGGELRCSGRVGSSCSTSGTRHVNLTLALINTDTQLNGIEKVVHILLNHIL